ncbi:hypothetical protein D1P53_004334 [Cryptococcus gattii VGV]|nr:hypothetical protein D1P53_004334 [Cryptococcus gattii VGV]
MEKSSHKEMEETVQFAELGKGIGKEKDIENGTKQGSEGSDQSTPSFNVPPDNHLPSSNTYTVTNPDSASNTSEMTSNIPRTNPISAIIPFSFPPTSVLGAVYPTPQTFDNPDRVAARMRKI